MYSESDLNAMTKAEIEALAVALGYEGVNASDNKATMIMAFMDAQGV